MTIDTSREAVERLNTHRVYIDRTMCFDEGITWTTVAGLYPHAYVPEDFALAILARAEAAEAERDAALAEVARLSHALAAETAKREAMEAALQNVMGHVDTPIGRRRLIAGSSLPEWLTEARATLAKHGSKT